MNQVFQFSQSPPLSLYIHLPWCVRKCPYCDFNSHEQKNGGIDEHGYVDALIRDLEISYPLIEKRDITSIFIGGGTPSLFTAASLERLLTAIIRKTNIKGDIEVTLEANPGTADASQFAAYRQIGINRLSLGIQSFNPEHLQAIGRVHDEKQALNAISFAKDAGFEQINLDLMYGLPGQNQGQAMEDLKIAIGEETVHLSWYQLTLEPNTIFYKRPPVLPLEEELWQIQESGKEIMHDAGFENYEISAYAKENMFCRHNLNYWRFGDYLGIGAGAHSKISDIKNNTITRYSRYKNPEKYMKLVLGDDAYTSNWELSSDDAILEYMMNGLRLTAGVYIRDFEGMTGLSYSKLIQQLKFAVEKELLDVTDEKIAPTAKGHNYLNDLLQCFMRPSSDASQV